VQVIQLYIEGNPIELFKDESISITDSIKSVRDIAKVFTAFSKTFTVPASRNNNKIFKHYYNFDIVNGFDARIRKDANIELNNLPYKKGKIKLEGVDLKNNKPYAYKITFFGSTVELKDILGDDKLSAITSLTTYNRLYDDTTIQDYLGRNPNSNDIIVPLITHTKRLFYDSVSHNNGDGNLYYHTGSGNNLHGVDWNELKYAIRLDAILKQIESFYGISFSSDFFNSSNDHYHNLFMWLHRKKGEVESPSGVEEDIVNTFTNETDSNTATAIQYNEQLWLFGTESYYTDKRLILSTTNTTDTYRVSVKRSGIEIFNTGDVTGSQTLDLSSYNFGSQPIMVYIQGENPIVFTNIQWFIEYSPNAVFTKTYSTTYSYGASFIFDITQQIPDIKVIDFISGLFKMFNLTAYVENDVIVVKTLDDFYAGGTTYDISKYVDIEKSNVNVALPYRKINFTHGDTKTFFAANHNQLFGKEWGKEEYTNQENLDGGIYDLVTPFSQMKFERLYDDATGNITTIQWGYSVDDNSESYKGKPLIFYPIKIPSATAISFLGNGTHISTSDYNIPSNSVSYSSAFSKENINFYLENNEYTGDTTFTDTLFESYYKNYITSAFNEKNRITKVTAYLPIRIIRVLSVADKIIINGKQYKINSLKINLLDGKSDLELLNDL
jgi:hypothetical protein